MYPFPKRIMLIIEGNNAHYKQLIYFLFLHYSHSEPLVWAHISFGQMFTAHSARIMISNTLFDIDSPMDNCIILNVQNSLDALF